MHPMLILHSICIVCIRATNTVLESTRIILLLLLYFVVGVSNVRARTVVCYILREYARRVHTVLCKNLLVFFVCIVLCTT